MSLIATKSNLKKISCKATLSNCTLCLLEAIHIHNTTSIILSLHALIKLLNGNSSPVLTFGATVVRKDLRSGLQHITGFYNIKAIVLTLIRIGRLSIIHKRW